MILGMMEDEFYAFLGLGVILNFIISLMFGLYLSKNIGIEEMMMSAGPKKQPLWIQLSVFIPFLKMIITLYRVMVLQFYFLDQGKSHKDFWVYMTQDYQ